MDIRKILSHWFGNKEDFDPKLVAREETGCCHSKPGGAGADNEEAPCNE